MPWYSGFPLPHNQQQQPHERKSHNNVSPIPNTTDQNATQSRRICGQRPRSQEESGSGNNRHPPRNLHSTRTFKNRLNPFIRFFCPCFAFASAGPANDAQKNTDLDRQSLSYCVSLIENGVNPEALAVSTHRWNRTTVCRSKSPLSRGINSTDSWYRKSSKNCALDRRGTKRV